MPYEINKNGSFPDVFENLRFFSYLEDGARGLDAHRAILGFSGVTLHQQTLHTHTHTLYFHQKKDRTTLFCWLPSLSPKLKLCTKPPYPPLKPFLSLFKPEILFLKSNFKRIKPAEISEHLIE